MMSSSASSLSYIKVKPFKNLTRSFNGSYSPVASPTPFSLFVQALGNQFTTFLKVSVS